MVSISLLDTIPLALAVQINPQTRAQIELRFEEAAEDVRCVFEEWEAELADEQAEMRAQRVSLAEYMRVRLEHIARKRPSSPDDRGNALIDCALHAWFPVNDALCNLADSWRYDIRKLSQQAFEAILRIIDLAYDRDLHLGLNVPLVERLRKPPLVDPADGAVCPWVMKKVERHDLWKKGKAARRAVLERHAAQSPAPAEVPASALGADSQQEATAVPSDEDSFSQRMAKAEKALADWRILQQDLTAQPAKPVPRAPLIAEPATGARAAPPAASPAAATAAPEPPPAPTASAPPSTAFAYRPPSESPPIVEAEPAQVPAPMEISASGLTASPDLIEELSAPAWSRFPKSVTSLIAARRMEKYLESNGIGQTEFAAKVGTTDRTLRQFRKSGKVRRDIFANIAKAMDTTPEKLLEPE